MPIFLSYSRKDEEVVNVLVQAAQREVWFAGSVPLHTKFAGQLR